VLFFFMAGLLLHFECVTIGSLTHPAGDRPSHSISVTAIVGWEAVTEIEKQLLIGNTC
jgi:hypothetical protein